MKNINYTIRFHTYWHCGSGLAAGADVDALVIKDRVGIPYIPGKTVKGLVREAVDEMLTFTKQAYDENEYLSVFGYQDENDETAKIDIEKKKSDTFFGNAIIEDYEEIKKNGIQRFLFNSLSSTAIEEDGVAKDHSLRKMEVVIPCALKGKIVNVPDGMVPVIKSALRFIKNMGANRNRGLGRCTITGKEADL